MQYGARPLKRAIQTYLEDGLSELIISSSLKEKDIIQVSLNGEKGELEMIMSDLRVWHFFCLYLSKYQLKLINR